MEKLPQILRTSKITHHALGASSQLVKRLTSRFKGDIKKMEYMVDLTRFLQYEDTSSNEKR